MNIDNYTAKIIFVALVILSIILLIVKFVVYRTTPEEVEYNILQKYLINNSSLAKSDKPILWLHNAYELNDRHWLSFGSRNTNELNKPIVYLTTHSIIKQCDKSFRICLIDDNSFANLIPGWSIDLDTIAEPSKSYYRTIAKLHLLHLYGGMHVPSSLLCFNNLAEIHDKYASKDAFYGVSTKSSSVVSTHTSSTPNLAICGSQKQCKSLTSLIKSLEELALRDQTLGTKFEGTVEKLVQHHVDDGKCSLIDGSIFGYFDAKGHPVGMNELMSDESLEMNDEWIGIEIPIDEIISNKHHQWMSKITVDDLVTMNNNIGHLLSQMYCAEK